MNARHALLLALAFALGGVAAFGAPGPRIALIVDGTDERTPRRVRAELEGLGFEVVQIDDADAADLRSLEDRARSIDAIAAVRVEPARSGVDVWVADRASGRTLLTEVVAAPGSAVDDVVALRVVELLRTSLWDLTTPGAAAAAASASASAPGAPASESVPTATGSASASGAAPPRWRAPREAHADGGAAAPEPVFVLGVGPALVQATLEAPPLLEVAVHARLALGGRAGLNAFTLVPTVPSKLEAAEGSARTALWLLGVGGDAQLLSERSSWRLQAGLAALAAHAESTGSARPPLGDGTAAAWTGGGLARVSGATVLGRRLRVGAGVGAGFLAPEVVTRFAGRDAATWGRPLLLAELLLETALP